MSTFSLHVHKLLLHDHWLISSHTLHDCEPAVVESGCRLVGWQLAEWQAPTGPPGPTSRAVPRLQLSQVLPAPPSPPRRHSWTCSRRQQSIARLLSQEIHNWEGSTLPTGGELVSADLAPSQRLRTSLSSPTALPANTLCFLST